MRETYRILDANCNRAREGLRVIEDYARFVVDDAACSSIAKALRGELQQLYASLGPQRLLAARDTGGDVGTAISTDAERRRDTAADVAVAACKRLPEALRTIEEYAKLLNPAVAARAEQMRYRAYVLEQRLMLRVALPARFARTRLYLLLTGALCKSDPIHTAGEALAGGVDCIQLREKTLPGRALLELARRLRELTTQHQALLIVNDRPDVATLTGADGVHLGQDDLPIDAARRIVGPGKLIGLSTHSVDQATAAAEAGADYIGVGPMFPTATKHAGPALGPDLLRDVLGAVDIPAAAIGGVNADNVGQLVEAGATRVAVSSAICAADDPRAAAQAIREQLPDAP